MSDSSTGISDSGGDTGVKAEASAAIAAAAVIQQSQRKQQQQY